MMNSFANIALSGFNADFCRAQRGCALLVEALPL
jgi:hypothetical protein